MILFRTQKNYYLWPQNFLVCSDFSQCNCEFRHNMACNNYLEVLNIDHKYKEANTNTHIEVYRHGFQISKIHNQSHDGRDHSTKSETDMISITCSSTIQTTLVPLVKNINLMYIFLTISLTALKISSSVVWSWFKIPYPHFLLYRFARYAVRLLLQVSLYLRCYTFFFWSLVVISKRSKVMISTSLSTNNIYVTFTICK